MLSGEIVAEAEWFKTLSLVTSVHQISAWPSVRLGSGIWDCRIMLEVASDTRSTALAGIAYNKPLPCI